jgi:AcrR family transcriptional regulator
VIATARTLFTTHGFHGTGIAQIAAESGVRVGQLYRDFPGKEAIVAAIVEADLVAFLGEESLHDAVARGELDAVRRWIGNFVCGHGKRADMLIPEICAEAARNGRIKAIMDDVDRRVRGELTLALAAFSPGPDRAGEVAVLADLVLTLKIGLANTVAIQPRRDVAALCARIEAVIDAELTALRRGAPAMAG